MSWLLRNGHMSPNGMLGSLIWVILLTGVVFSFSSETLQAQGRKRERGKFRHRPERESKQLRDFLKEDGTIDRTRATDGSYDATGFRMSVSQSGAPVFTSVVDGNWRWDDRFNWTGFDRTASAIAISGSDIYVGGTFTDAFGVPGATNIARWDGSNWTALGTGLNRGVMAIAVSGSDVYVGGWFTDAGGVAEADYVAKWNGSNWSGLGSGVNSGVRAIAVSGSGLIYVGGSFTVNGSPTLTYLAKWDGTTWSAVGGAGLNGDVNSISLQGDSVYIGGRFTDAGGLGTADKIALWDGAAWSSVGGGLNDDVLAVKVHGSDVYALGWFTGAGGETGADYIARYSDGSWHAMGTIHWPAGSIGITESGDIYIGGSFGGWSGDPDGVAHWNGSSWETVGSGLSANGQVNAFGVAGDVVYFAGGNFDNFQDNVVRWDGANLAPWWAITGNGMGGDVYSIAISGSDVYVGGWFQDAGGIPEADNIAKWNGSSWSALGGGMLYPDEWVNDIEVSGSDVYVGGWFQDVGGIPEADGIAKWNGNSWSALGSGPSDGVNTYVNVVSVRGSSVYIGGTFDDMGGVATADNIAKWDGTAWSGLGSGVNDEVSAIAFASDSVMYAGGWFQDAGGDLNADYIAKWNGATWLPVGNGLDWVVYALAVIDTNLYVGGWFQNAGGDASADYVAMLNAGGNWTHVGTGLSGLVWNFEVHNSNLYAIGAFNGLMKWDGSSWSVVDTSIGDDGYALAFGPHDMYVGGWFRRAGNVMSRGFAHYFESPALTRALRDTTFDEDFGRRRVCKLSDYFSRASHLTLTYSVQSLAPGGAASTGALDISPSVSGDTLYLTSALNSNGQADVRVTASDGSYTVSDIMRVTVNPVADPPMITRALRDTTFDQDFSKRMLCRLSEFFSDPDGDALSYSALSLSSGVTATVSQDTLYLEGSSGFVGYVNVRVTASDGSLTISDTFAVRTLDRTRPVVFAGALATEVVDVVRLGVGANEALKMVTVHVGATSLSMVRQGDLYFGNYRLGDTSDVRFDITALDTADNQDTLTRSYHVASLGIDKYASFAGYVIGGEDRGYLLCSRASVEKYPAGHILVGEGISLLTTGRKSRLDISYSYDASLIGGSDGDERKIGIYRKDGDVWTYVGGQGKSGVVRTTLSGAAELSRSFGSFSGDAVYAVFYNPAHSLIPENYDLSQNYPNPFNPTTAISYQLPVSGHVTLKIYNVLGQEVRTLVKGFQSAGYQSIVWDGRNNSGQTVGSGLYVYRLESGNFVRARKMLMIK